MNAALNEEFWSRPEQEVIDDLVAGGMPVDQATVAVRSVQNSLGIQTDAEANRGGSMTVTRVQAPLTDPNDPSSDPSPDSLAQARQQG